MPYGIAPTFKNVTCFDRWAPMAQAKAHPTLLRRFGTQRTHASPRLRRAGGAKYYHWRGQWLEGRIKNLEFRMVTATDFYTETIYT